MQATTQRIVDGSVTARAPTNVPCDQGGFDERGLVDDGSVVGIVDASETRFADALTVVQVTTSPATSAAATPAVVPSTVDGNTLLVPVEMAISGTSGQPVATSRHVPSPPSTTTAPTCSFHIDRAAAIVSRWEPVNGLSSELEGPVEALDGPLGETVGVGAEQRPGRRPARPRQRRYVA